MDDSPVSSLEFFNQTTLHPLGLAAVLICGLALLVLPRRCTVCPLIVVACFVATSQRIVVFGLDFNLLRIMVLFGWLRVLFRGESRQLVWKPLDSVMLAWAVSAVLMFTASRGTFDAFVNRLGFVYDAFGMYFFFRCVVRGWEDVRATTTGLALISIPVAILFLVESETGRNAFSFFGGVREFTLIRHGRLRCQGAFAHSILAGCFWAAVVPLMAAGWWAAGRRRLLALVGLTASLIIVVCSSSSTPVGATLNGVLAALLFPLRRHMRTLRWTALLLLGSLHLVMKAPVWHLIARVQFVGGSTSWHRYNLINKAINHFGDWWVLGLPADGSIGVDDITNQYVLEGLRGGFLTMVLFLLVVALAFQGVGRIWRTVEHSRPHLALAWALGVALWVHCVSFIGVSYFGQIIVIWYLQLAIIGSLVPAAAARLASAGSRPRPLVPVRWPPRLGFCDQIGGRA